MRETLERIKGVVELQMSEHLTTSSQVPDPCVTCYWWGWVVFGWARRDVNVLERNKGFLGVSFFYFLSQLKRESVTVVLMLIGIFLSVHLILDPLQHVLHPPQLWREMTQVLVNPTAQLIMYTQQQINNTRGISLFSLDHVTCAEWTKAPPPSLHSI